MIVMFGLDLDEKISFKYPDVVPQQYDTSEIQYTFDFINLVLKQEYSFDNAVKDVADKYNISSDYLKDFLIENKYVLNNMNKNEFSNQIKNYTTKSLKKILKKHGIKKSGKRKVIEKRIFENNLLVNTYYLSSKSKIFYKNKKRRIRIFNEFLKDVYYFNEFNEYYMDNYRKKENKIPIEFVRQFISKAIMDKNHRMYVLNNHVLGEIFLERKNYKNMMHCVLSNFCINLNPVWKIDDLKNHGGFSQLTYDNLLFLKGKLGKNRIISAYYVIWDSFNFDEIIVSKYMGYRYLKDILNLKSYNKIINELTDNFYSNDDLKIKKITQKTLFDF